MYFRSLNSVLQRRIISRNDRKIEVKRSIGYPLDVASFLFVIPLCISFTLHKFVIVEIGTSLSRSRFSYRIHTVAPFYCAKKRAITGLANFFLFSYKSQVKRCNFLTEFRALTNRTARILNSFRKITSVEANLDWFLTTLMI